MAHQVMPFDMTKTLHIFKMTEQGGVQTVVSRDPAAVDQIALIQMHLQHEAEKFQSGDYADPATLHGANMPGLKAIKEGSGCGASSTWSWSHNASCDSCRLLFAWLTCRCRLAIDTKRCTATAPVSTAFASMTNGGFVFAGPQRVPKPLKLSITTEDDNEKVETGQPRRIIAGGVFEADGDQPLPTGQGNRGSRTAHRRYRCRQTGCQRGYGFASLSLLRFVQWLLVTCPGSA